MDFGLASATPKMYSKHGPTLRQSKISLWKVLWKEILGRLKKDSKHFLEDSKHPPKILDSNSNTRSESLISSDKEDVDESDNLPEKQLGNGIQKIMDQAKVSLEMQRDVAEQLKEFKQDVTELKELKKDVVDQLKELKNEVANLRKQTDKQSSVNNTSTATLISANSTAKQAIPSTSAAASHLFTSKPFNANISNPSGRVTSTFDTTQPTPFAFNSPRDNSVRSTFCTTPSFGAFSVSGTTENPATSFGTSVNSPRSVVAGANQNAPFFGTAATQNPPAVDSQPVLGQSIACSTSTSENTPFGRRESTQSNTIFGGTTTLNNSIFGGTASTAAIHSMFGDLLDESHLSLDQNVTKGPENEVDGFIPAAKLSPIVADIYPERYDGRGTVLFEQYAKLLQFDSDSNQWKEKRIGQMKISHYLSTQEVHLLMRSKRNGYMSDFYHTVDTKSKFSSFFQFMIGSNKTVIWCAQDTSKEKYVPAMYAFRFKTADQASKFYKVLTSLQNNMVFKRTAGSWECKVCYVLNTPTDNYCLVCNSPKHPSMPPKLKTCGFNITSSSTSAPSFSFGISQATPRDPALGSTFDTAKSNAEVAGDTVKTLVPQQPGPAPSFGTSPKEPALVFTFGKPKFHDNDAGGFTFIKTMQTDPTPTLAFRTPTSPAATAAMNMPNVISISNDRVMIAMPSLKMLNETETPITGKSPEKSHQNLDLNVIKDPEDKVDEFVPTAEFSPVIALPDIVEVVTGEEGETVLFEERAKLFRFDSDSNQWKERGIGQMKILLDPATGKVRLLMRREQVLKVCCNHLLLAEIKFSFMTGTNKACSWCAQDYSEGEVVPVMFAIRFKTADQASEFYNVLTSQQKKMVNDRIPTEAAPQKTTDKNVKEPTKEIKGDSKQNKSLAEMFKPRVGSWECGTCYTRNDSTKSKCLACDSPAPNATKTTVIKSPVIAEQPISGTASLEVNPTATGQSTTSSDKVPLLQLFKPSAGSWDCKSCYLVNSASNNYCVACDSPKDPSMPPKPKTSGFNITSSSASAPSFSFGISQAAPKDPALGFAFGTSQSDAKAAGDTAKTPIGFSFGTSNLNSSATFTFGTPQNLGVAQNHEKPFQFGSPGKLFDFQFQHKSPVKSPGGDETSEEEVVKSEDVYFPPVIPLPDKVDIKTGEENEAVLYSHGAKLFRYESATKEWKERGLGDIKLLKHRETGKLRLIMRRDQVLKLCLNHVITPDMEFTAKDDKTWLWHAADYSEGDISHENFACRFKTAEVAQEFKTAIDNAKGSVKTPADKAAPKTITKLPEKIRKNLFGSFSSSSDIQIVYEKTVTEEEKVAALKLKLPENFYAYKNMPDCLGCIGCRDPNSSTIGENTEIPKLVISPPKFEVEKRHVGTSVILSESTLFVPSKSTTESPHVATSVTSLPGVEESKTTSSSLTGSSTPTSTSSASILSLDDKPVGKAFVGFTSTMSSPGVTPPALGNTFSPKSTIPFGTPATSNLISEGATSAVTTTSQASEQGGSTLRQLPNATIPIATSTVPILESSTSSANVSSSGGSTEKMPNSEADANPLVDLKMCNPASFATPTTLPTSNTLAGSGNPVFGNNVTPTASIFDRAKSAVAVFDNIQTVANNTFINCGTGAPKSNIEATGTTASSNKLLSTTSTNSLFGVNNETTSLLRGTVNEELGSSRSGLKPDTLDDRKTDAISYLPTDNAASSSTLAAKAPQRPALQTDPSLSFVKASASVIGTEKPVNINSPQSHPPKEDTAVMSNGGDEEVEEKDNCEEHDPHLVPIVPLPDATEMRTGKEHEEKS